MIVTVNNCDDEDLIEFILDSVNYFLSKLLSKRLLNSIVLSINFIEDTKNYGSTDIVGYNKAKKARQFSVEIRKHMNAKMTFETLAHEMVHVKQFALGELSPSHDRWKGVEFDSDKVEYHFLPWEIEANGICYALFLNYTLEHQLWNVFNDIDDPFDYYGQKNIWKNK